MDSVYERALLEIGSNEKFQKRFDVLYNFVFASSWAMTYNNIILALVIIPHMCQLPQINNNTTDYDSLVSKFIPLTQDLKYSSCLIYSSPDESNVTKGCDAYFYNITWYGSTIPSSNNWVCDNEIKVANIFAYGKVGEVLGSVTFGWLGDIYGRRITYIAALGLLVIGRLISIAGSNSFTIFAIGCVIAWFPSWSAVQSATVISMEISAPERRSLTATYRAVANSIGMCIMPFLYWWLSDWMPFMLITTMPQLLFFIFSWKILESPRWLLIEGRKKSCVKELKRIAQINNTNLEDETEQDILNTTTRNKDQVLGPLSLFSGRKIAMNTALQLYLWVSVSLSYMVLIMSSGEKADGNPFLEFAWQSIVEVPATFVGAWLADNIGRRYAGATSYLISAIMWMLIAVKENGNWIQNWWIGSSLVIINRLATTVSYYVIYLLNMELYPTSLRQSGMSLGNVFSSGACAIAPYLMYAGRRVDSRIPGIFLTLTALLGLLSSLILPETLNAKLPETLKDAQNFDGRKKCIDNSLNLKEMDRDNLRTVDFKPVRKLSIFRDE